MVYYNEYDPHAAAWLRELVQRNLIAPGHVDDRSILEVTPNDLKGYTQCHFFAGIGVWSYALRRAGWRDDEPVWTGSPPCQSFSAAGKGKGFDDERHLWPAFFDLIRQCRPPVLFGAQVEAAIRFGWLDLVQTDLEGIDYAFGAFGLPAAGFGAPHIRARLYFVGERSTASFGPNDGWMGHGFGPRLEGHGRDGDHGSESGRIGEDAAGSVAEAGSAGGVADDPSPGRESRRGSGDAGLEGDNRPVESGRLCADSRVADNPSDAGPSSSCDDHRPGPTNGFWAAADWLFCRDGKWRPVEPGTFPLAHGSPARVGRLRGYGNAIVAEVAQGFIEAYLEARAERDQVIDHRLAA